MTAQEPYYTADRLDGWLRDWPLLVSLAETPRSSTHHLRPGHADHDGPCLDSPRSGRGGGLPRGGCWADVVADIEVAILQLRPYGLQWGVVDLRRRTGASLGEIARGMRVRKAVVCEAYRAALEAMAAHLEPGEQLTREPETRTIC